MPTIRRFLDLSLEHVSAADLIWLKEQCLDRDPEPSIILCARTQFGFFMFAYEESDHTLTQLYNVSPAMHAIMIHARRHKCEYVLFDVDAPNDPELKLYRDEEGNPLPETR